MATVYKARQTSMHRLVAVKVLHPRLAADARLLNDIVREARMAARLSHSNIVQAIDAGQAGPIHYFVMEFVEGKTIREELDAGKVYGEEEAVSIALQVARALEHAGKRGLVHRDVKPANVVLTADGVAKLADLGMAFAEGDPRRAQRERGLMIGTPYYMAPEQIKGRADVDARADLYALGATLYHMVTGRPPYPSTDVDAVIHAHLHAPLKPPDTLNPDLSPGLVEVITMLLRKDRRSRYQSAADLVTDLECLQRGEPPRLTRSRPELGALAALADGDADEPEEAPAKAPKNLHDVQRLLFVLGVLGGLLVLSVLCNVVLLLRK
jgi:serine/threonine-protein kinase